MKAYFEFRDNSKISTASAKGPREVGVFVGIGAHHRAVSGHQSKAFHVIAGKPVKPSQPAESTSENQAGGARVRYDAGGKGQSVVLSGLVDRTKKTAALEACPAGRRVHGHVAHFGKVDYQPAVTAAEAGKAVPPAAQCG